MKDSKLLLRLSFIITFAFCVFGFFGQSTGPLLADGAIAPVFVSYSPGDATASSSLDMMTKKRSEWLVTPHEPGA